MTCTEAFGLKTLVVRRSDGFELAVDRSEQIFDQIKLGNNSAPRYVLRRRG